jgi:hypothetical protein
MHAFKKTFGVRVWDKTLPPTNPSFTELMTELMKRLLRAYTGFRIYSVS